jgi:hypothetical protein
MALFVISGAAGLGLTVVLANRQPLLAGLLIGVYLLFSIKVADQWEKVADYTATGCDQARPNS